MLRNSGDDGGDVNDDMCVTMKMCLNDDNDVHAYQLQNDNNNDDDEEANNDEDDDVHHDDDDDFTHIMITTRFETFDYFLSE
jgi:hypothetical protein